MMVYFDDGRLRTTVGAADGRLSATVGFGHGVAQRKTLVRTRSGNGGTGDRLGRR
jgi:hypothetical protein